ncbi:MAG: DUF5683 domain-containing protein [Saprospiraceae bacterium]|jgi:hypothetical protein
MPTLPISRFPGSARSFLAGALLAIAIAPLCAQQADTVPSAPAPVADTLARDSSNRREPGFFNFRKTFPNPRTALRLSLVLPGAGQLYNGKWWKVPVVYAGIGAMVVAVDFNQDRYRRLKTALELQLQNKPHEFSGRINTPDALRSLRNNYDRQTQLSYIGTVVVYAVVAVEAFVDAHLQNFDTDENLGFHLKPVLVVPPAQGTYAGIGLAWAF